jgi:hypothetical protein
MLLCELYEEWGGDCADLGLTPGGWVDTVTEEYAAEGAPQLDAAGVAALLDLLNKLEAHLGLPANSLGATDTNRLLSLIASLRADLNPTA